MRLFRGVAKIAERKEVAYVAGICVCLAGALFFIADRMGGDAFILRSDAPIIRTGTATTTGVIIEIDHTEGLILLQEEGHARLLIETAHALAIEDETGTAIPLGFLDTGFRIGLAGSIKGTTFAATHLWIIQSPEIVIREPASGAEVGDAFIVRGLALSSSHTLAWRLTDTSMRAQVRGIASVHAINGSRYGFFSFPVNVKKTSLHNEEILLEISTTTEIKEDAHSMNTMPLILIDQPMFATSLYFPNVALDTTDACESVYETARLMPATTTPELASVQAILRGPTPQETQNGFIPLVPADPLIDHVFTMMHNRALITLIGPVSTLSECRKRAVISAFTHTLTQFPHIREVRVVFEAD